MARIKSKIKIGLYRFFYESDKALCYLVLELNAIFASSIRVVHVILSLFPARVKQNRNKSIEFSHH